MHLLAPPVLSKAQCMDPAGVGTQVDMPRALQELTASLGTCLSTQNRMKSVQSTSTCNAILKTWKSSADNF